VLLQRWRDTQGLPRRFGDREARQVLQPLAHWLHQQPGRTHADAPSLAAAIEPHLVAALGYEVEGEAFVRAVSTKDGILTAKGGDSYGLLQLGFQEYLCARHLRSLSHGDPGVLDRLAERFGDPWWREVTLLLLALGEPALFDPLMRRILERSAFVEHQDWVADCIHEAAEVSLAPFLELLVRPPGADAELWRRQLAVWRMLEKLDPEPLAGVAAGLRDHPLEELRRLAGHDGRFEPATIRAARGAYALVELPAGRFMMGSHPRERGRRGDEGPRHEVELASFWIGKHPVTNEEYGLYLRACPEVAEPCYWGDPRFNQPQQPVVGVSWHEAAAYCAWAGLRLPTEAQWEYACRAGTTDAYWSGRGLADLVQVGWFADNSGQRPHAVAEKPANAFGLYDVHGNVWEWCQDNFGDYLDHPPRAGDGLRHAPQEGGNRVIRGGSWIDRARTARSAYRLNRHADNRPSNLGFRAVKLVEPDDG
jgi:formylglycine-generating enzyme required for sulfatase activity